MADSVLTGNRSRLDSSFVDMTLFLNANFDSIPTKVEEIKGNKGEWLCKVPNRFTGIEEDTLKEQSYSICDELDFRDSGSI